VGRCGAVGALDRWRFTFIHGATRRTLSLHLDHNPHDTTVRHFGGGPCETRWRPRRLSVRAETPRVQRLDAGRNLEGWRAVRSPRWTAMEVARCLLG
jgi:hypothetical protein